MIYNRVVNYDLREFGTFEVFDIRDEIEFETYWKIKDYKFKEIIVLKHEFNNITGVLLTDYFWVNE